MSRIVKIFDTTLRDGEQCPGGSMNKKEKLLVAQKLAQLGVDVIEAGFPSSSDDNFDGVRLIAQEIKGPVIAGLARATEADIYRTWEAIRFAERPRIHTFISTSDLHMECKLKKNREDVLDMAVAAVRYARQYTEDVEFSPEDATRSDYDFLFRVIDAVIEAGATTINIPDTVGYATPNHFGNLIRLIRKSVPNIDQSVISIHCHNDLGLAVANSLAAITEGAGQVECTINGIGERAGNAALEEVVMALCVHKDLFGVTTNIRTEEITRASRLVSSITGFVVQPNKAIVGANAFAHEAGIHAHAVIINPMTYQIMTPESVGLNGYKIVLGKHSGRHALQNRLEKMGFSFSDDQIDTIFERFKQIADQKKEIFEEDLEAIITETIYQIPDIYELVSFFMETGIGLKPMVTIALKIRGITYQDRRRGGDGPVDAICELLRIITKTHSNLLSYSAKGITGGADAIGEVTIQLEEDEKIFFGRGIDTDTNIAAAKAYLNALNKIYADKAVHVH